MKSKQAFGFIEVAGLCAGLTVADTMIKTANITVNDMELSKGAGCVLVKVLGEVSAVEAAILAGKQTALSMNKYVGSSIIPRPTDDTNNVFLFNKTAHKKDKYPKKSTIVKKTKKEEVIIDLKEDKKDKENQETKEIKKDKKDKVNK